MNCKSGDLAIVECPNPHWNGVLVEVLYAAPTIRFLLPDGYPSRPGKPASWVLKLLCGPKRVRLDYNDCRDALYGVGEDKYLRPLRGLPDEVEDSLPVTVKANEP